MTTRRSERFANQIHLALYGETFEERVKKEKIMEKTFIVQKLVKLNILSVSQIAEVVNESEDFVQKIKDNQNKK